MSRLKRLINWAYEHVEAGFDLAFGQHLNPFAWLGALGWYFFWIVAISGVYLYIFFDTGVTDAYASVQYMTRDQWYLAGVMRSLHRYASDALVVVVALHLLREFSLDRLRGKRFFAWLTGIPALVFVYLCGISGYWLVWDRLAQYIAIATSEWLDALPLFGEPIANNFLNSTTLGDRFFTLMVFIHIFTPLFMLLLMWIHVQRHASAKVNPPKPLAVGTGAMLLVLSILQPAVSQGPANLDLVPGDLGLDWFYLAVYPLLDTVPGGTLWLALGVALLLLALLPWLPPQRSPDAAVVSLDHCNGCARCFDDCPYGAITMVARTDGKSYETEAAVDPAICLSCGICAGACPTATPFRRTADIVPGIQLPDRTIGRLRAETIETSAGFVRGRRMMIFACEHSGYRLHDDDRTRVIRIPCVAMLPPSFLDFVLSRNLADGIAIAGCAGGDCFFRLGGDWMAERLAGTRDPYLRRRVDRARLRFWRYRASDRRAQRLAATEFAEALDNLPKNHSRGRRPDV